MFLLPVLAQPASKHTPHGAAATPADPGYKSESPLPEGWPQPGPFNQVVKKSYPAYRAAFTRDDSPNGGFMTLFRHIERNNIPMTAPVEMKLDDGVGMQRMAFLYQNSGVGKPGCDGKEVEVRDVPAAEALSYAWMGPRSKAKEARKAVDDELARLGLKAREYRLLGYNSPFVPRSKQTHELQALLE